MAKMPTIDEMARDVVAAAFDFKTDGKTLREWIDIVKEYRSNSWISVKDRLPNDDSHYLVWVSDAHTVERAVYYGDGEWLTEELENLTRFVTHWMPLPKAPKEEW